MANPLQRISVKILKVLSLTLLNLIVVGCSTTPLEPLKVNPCSVLPDIKMCQAVPLNQDSKPEYERIIIPGDVCFTIDEYAQLQKDYREMMKRCGEKCR